MRRGDIIVNPWVSVDYCGELNPMYATIYLGNNFSLDYKGRKHSWADKVYKENAEHRCPWKVIGHIDLDEIIETAIRKAVKTENSSEKPNNCEDEPTWEQVKEYCNRRCLDIVDSALRKKWYKDEPQTCSFIDCGNFKNPDYERCIECKRKQIKLKTEQTEWCSE